MRSQFGIVIPVYNLHQYLPSTLRSIFFQEGGHSVHVHVQDGGYGNQVEKIATRFQTEIDSRRGRLTYSHESDKNAADAINKGMARINARLVSWLGADDILLPGCFEAISSVRSKFPEIKWLTGHPQVMSETGVLMPIHGPAGVFRRPTGFSREAVRRGLHASASNHGVIQQEGTFWELELWRAVGGLDTQFSLAFDFDLWCRMAEHAELVELATPLAAFRRREGQMSERTKEYEHEVGTIRDARRAKYQVRRPGKSLERLRVTYPTNSPGVWNSVRLPYIVDYRAKEVSFSGIVHLGTLPHLLASWFSLASPTSFRLRRLFRTVSAMLRRCR